MRPIVWAFNIRREHPDVNRSQRRLNRSGRTVQRFAIPNVGLNDLAYATGYLKLTTSLDQGRFTAADQPYPPSLARVMQHRGQADI